MSLQCLSAVWLLVPPQRCKRPLASEDESPMPFGCVASGALERNFSFHPSSVLSPMPFGCVASGAMKSKIDPTSASYWSPMPFGCVASGAGHTYVHSAARAQVSPMPFGCVASGAATCADGRYFLRFGLQCLSAVWLLVPRPDLGLLLVGTVSNAFRLCGFWCQRNPPKTSVSP